MWQNERGGPGGRFRGVADKRRAGDPMVERTSPGNGMTALRPRANGSFVYPRSGFPAAMLNLEDYLRFRASEGSRCESGFLGYC